jgi:large subunit ribosomal protein L29
MIMAKLRQLRGLEEKDAASRLAELRLELAKERASSEIGTVKNTGRIRAIRNDIARILTIQNERRLGIGKAKPAPAKAKEKVQEVAQGNKSEVKR